MSPASFLNEVSSFLVVKTEIFFFHIEVYIPLYSMNVSFYAPSAFFGLCTLSDTNAMAIWSFRRKNTFNKCFSDPYLALRCAEGG